MGLKKMAMASTCPLPNMHSIKDEPQAFPGNAKLAAVAAVGVPDLLAIAKAKVSASAKSSAKSSVKSSATSSAMRRYFYTPKPDVPSRS